MKVLWYSGARAYQKPLYLIKEKKQLRVKQFSSYQTPETFVFKVVLEDASIHTITINKITYKTTIYD